MKQEVVDSFFALVRAGFWEKDVRLSELEKIDFNEVCQLAEEQSVMGIVAAGQERVVVPLSLKELR